MNTDSNGNYTGGNDGLTYLLSDQARQDQYNAIKGQNLSDSFNNNASDLGLVTGDSYSESVKGNGEALLSSGNTAMLLNPRPENIDSMIKFISNIIDITATSHSPNYVPATDGKPANEPGDYLGSLLFGSSKSSYGRGETALGERVGPLVTIYEQEYL
ncbi:hypothetical protein Zmor_003890 [Zophobas morio]|uniref:Uncharacterized protein n=1 Tax=Zophobas morio TaxID=2755281 RepID=A0AA38M186_9CUCU|nr:hypothetical protein Zmor_003890 [Zophobas morio]